MLERSHPSHPNYIPDPNSMNICKLGSGVSLTPDTCNGVRKTRCLIVDQVLKAAESLLKDYSDDIPILEVDFWNHLRNVWIVGMTKALSTLFRNTMREELDGID